MNMLLLLFALLPHNFHGCALSPDGFHGWAVTLDTVPFDTLSIIHTSNSGFDWLRQVNPAERQFFDVTCLDSLNAWISGVTGVILGTDDGGKTWTIETDGHTKYYARIQIIDTINGFAAGGDGIFGRMVGDFWQRVFTPWWQTDFYGVSFVDTLEGWMCGRPALEAGGEASQIVHTTNGGYNWELQLEDSVYDFLDVCFIDSLEGWVVGGKDTTYEARILHTTNGGVEWKVQPNITDGFYLRSVEFVDSSVGWAGGKFGTILKTTDGGESWNSQPNPADSTIFDIEFVDYYRGIAVGNRILLYTYDGGNNWYEGIVGIEEEEEDISRVFTVSPNPFIERTVISYQLSVIGKQPITDDLSPNTLNIYDLTGRLVRNLTPYTSRLTPYKVTWDGKDDHGIPVPAGLYLCVLNEGKEMLVSKIIKIR